MAASQQDMLTGTRLSLRWNNHINTISEALSTFKNKVNLIKNVFVNFNFRYRYYGPIVPLYII